MESINRSRPREPAQPWMLAQPWSPAQQQLAQPEPVDAASAGVFSPPLPASGPPRGLPDAVARLGVPTAYSSPPPHASQPDRDRAPGS